MIFSVCVINKNKSMSSIEVQLLQGANTVIANNSTMRSSRIAFRGQAVLQGCSVDVVGSSVTAIRIRGLLDDQARIATSAPGSSSVSQNDLLLPVAGGTWQTRAKPLGHLDLSSQKQVIVEPIGGNVSNVFLSIGWL